MSSQDFAVHASSINALATEDVRRPTIPVAEFIQEAEDLYHWCQPDKAELKRVGLDWSLVESLPSRAGATRHAQSQWNAIYLAQKEAQKQFNELSPEAYDLRNELLHHLFYAFRKAPDLLSRTRQIAEGTGDADLVQDLSDIYVLASQNMKYLEAIGLTTAPLERARNLSQTLARVLGAAHSEDKTSTARVTRDRAFTYLKQAMDEIRETGRYVFWRTPDRLRGYASDYTRQRNKHQRTKAVEEATTQPMPTIGGDGAE